MESVTQFGVCKTSIFLSVISGFRRHVRADLSSSGGVYAASNGNRLATFRDNVSVPSSRVYLSGGFLSILKLRIRGAKAGLRGWKAGQLPGAPTYKGR
jgi:hypothetical protein